MGCFYRMIGIMSLVLAVGTILFWTLDTSPSNAVIEGLFCKDNEELVRQTTEVESVGSDDSGQSIIFRCRDDAGAMREVTGSVVLITIVTFIVPLLTGIAAIIYSARFSRRSLTSMVLNSVGVPMMDFSNIPATTVQFMRNIPTNPAQIDETLAKLQMLVQQGMLTQEQYNQIEQQLRNNQQFYRS